MLAGISIVVCMVVSFTSSDNMDADFPIEFGVEPCQIQIAAKEGGISGATG